MKPAFIAAMAAMSKKAPSAPSSSRLPATARAPPKRVRVSELSRKYRTGILTDESQLVGAPSMPSTSSSPSSSPSSNDTKDSHGRICLSRFPRTWDEAVVQACEAACDAAGAGHDRIRVDLCASKTRGPGGREMVLDAAGKLAMCMASFADGLSQTRRQMFSPREAVVLCENEAEAEKMQSRLNEMPLPARTGVLGQFSSASLAEALVVVVAPSNAGGNPQRIEMVEMVHYSNWNVNNWVVLLNPDLVALTSFPGMNGKARAPCFLGDYVSSYYVDPTAFPSKIATGAVLRCFPRKWEMYLLKVRSDMGFRLVAEQPTQPSEEKIECEFSWRVEREIDAQKGSKKKVEERQLVG